MEREATPKKVNNRAFRDFSGPTRHYAKERAGQRCEVCGATGTKDFPLAVHHLLPIAIIREEYPYLSNAAITSLHNTLVVCRTCHRQQDQESFSSPREKLTDLLVKLAIHYSILMDAGWEADEKDLVTTWEDPVRTASRL